MYLKSPAYSDGETMPVRFASPKTAGGTGVSVPIEWGDAPETTRSFVLAMVDLHPVAHGWVHWLVIDIPPTAHALVEGASGSPSMPAGAIELPNTGGRRGYGGPLPPVGSGAHDYLLAAYALDTSRIGVGNDGTWDDVRAAIERHVIDSAKLLGRFSR